MTQKEFIEKVIGLPWVNRASSFESVDCWGLVILYYKNVLNINLPEVKGYEEKEGVTTCWIGEANKKHWIESDKPQMDGVVFTCYRGDNPFHVGVAISKTHVLHTTGYFDSGGTVQVNSIKAIEKIYGKITYHKFID